MEDGNYALRSNGFITVRMHRWRRLMTVALAAAFIAAAVLAISAVVFLQEDPQPQNAAEDGNSEPAPQTENDVLSANSTPLLVPNAAYIRLQNTTVDEVTLNSSEQINGHHRNMVVAVPSIVPTIGADNSMENRNPNASSDSWYDSHILLGTSPEVIAAGLPSSQLATTPAATRPNGGLSKFSSVAPRGEIAHQNLGNASYHLSSKFSSFPGITRSHFHTVAFTNQDAAPLSNVSTSGTNPISSSKASETITEPVTSQTITKTSEKGMRNREENALMTEGKTAEPPSLIFENNRATVTHNTTTAATTSGTALPTTPSTTVGIVTPLLSTSAPFTQLSATSTASLTRRTKLRSQQLPQQHSRPNRINRRLPLRIHNHRRHHQLLLRELLLRRRYPQTTHALTRDM